MLKTYQEDEFGRVYEGGMENGPTAEPPMMDEEKACDEPAPSKYDKKIKDAIRDKMTSW